MKQLTIPKVNVEVTDMEAVTALMSNMPVNTIEEVNWADTYPNKPQVSFRIAHTGNHLIVKYEVHEDEIAATVENDNGNVWEDSCVEMFLAFDEEHYYNLECNCIGSVLFRYQDNLRKQIRMYSPQRLKQITRCPSLKHEKIALKKGNFNWSMLLILPHTLFKESKIMSFDSLRLRGNFYKCGDNLSQPHFVSWNKIESPEPNFHLPQYFGEIILCE